MYSRKAFNMRIWGLKKTSHIAAYITELDLRSSLLWAGSSIYHWRTHKSSPMTALGVHAPVSLNLFDLCPT